jgi:hypothetical protein
MSSSSTSPASVGVVVPAAVPPIPYEGPATLRRFAATSGPWEAHNLVWFFEDSANRANVWLCLLHGTTAVMATAKFGVGEDEDDGGGNARKRAFVAALTREVSASHAFFQLRQLWVRVAGNATITAERVGLTQTCYKFKGRELLTWAWGTTKNADREMARDAEALATLCALMEQARGGAAVSVMYA